MRYRDGIDQEDDGSHNRLTNEDGDSIFSPIPVKGIEEVLTRVKIRVLSFICYLLIGAKLEKHGAPLYNTHNWDEFLGNTILRNTGYFITRMAKSPLFTGCSFCCFTLSSNQWQREGGSRRGNCSSSNLFFPDHNVSNQITIDTIISMVRPLFDIDSLFLITTVREIPKIVEKNENLIANPFVIYEWVISPQNQVIGSSFHEHLWTLLSLIA